MANFLFKFPSRGRAKKFKEVLDLYYNYLSNKHSYEFIISADNDDISMNNNDIKEYVKSKGNAYIYFGNNKNKIQAVNADIEKAKTSFDIIFLISDDMIPKIKGFDDIIYQDMIKNFPDYDGVLHYNDGNAGEKLNTLSIMGKKMFDYFGYFYNEDYVSLWADNEFDDVSKNLNKKVYIDNVIVKHEWANDDHLYAVNNKWFNRDWQVYEKRKALGFPNKKIIPYILSAKDEVDFKPVNVPKEQIKVTNQAAAVQIHENASETLKRLYKKIQENKKR